MILNLRMLGTGSAFAKVFNNNNALITVEQQTLMIDCGITAPKALFELGLTFDEIHAVLITHIHADHVGGLEEYAFQMKYIYGRKPILYLAEQLIQPLWEHTLKGGLQQYDTETLEDFFDVRPLHAGVNHELIPGLQVELIPTLHIPNKPNFSILMNESLFYSGDMTFDPELLSHLVKNRNISIILHDCQLEPPGVVHTSLSQLLTLPPSIQECIYLMHYSDDQPSYIGKTGFMTFIKQSVVYKVKELSTDKKFGLIELAP